MPSTRSLALGAGVAGFVVLQGLAAAQPSTVGDDLGFGNSVVIKFLVSLVAYLLLGGALLVLGPRYTNEVVTDLQDEPAEAFFWGLLVGVVAPIALVILALTIVGLIVAIPGFVILFVLGVVGTAVTVAWTGTVLTGTGDSVDGYAVGVGALAFAFVSAIPVVGGVLTSLVGLFGLGVVSRNVYASRSGGSGRKTRPEREAVRRREDI